MQNRGIGRVLWLVVFAACLWLGGCGSSASTGQALDDDRTSPWRAVGRVTDGEGRPMAGVTVRTAAGVGTMRGGGETTSDRDGRYEVLIRPGLFTGPRDVDISPQFALIGAYKDGWFERELNQHGWYTMAAVQSDASKLRPGTRGTILPGQPVEVNFAMVPAAVVTGQMVDTDGRAIAGFELTMDGRKSYPATSVLTGFTTNRDGRFTVPSVPTHAYHFSVSRSGRGPSTDIIRFDQPGPYHILLRYDADRQSLRAEVLSRPA